MAITMKLRLTQIKVVKIELLPFELILFRATNFWPKWVSLSLSISLLSSSVLPSPPLSLSFYLSPYVFHPDSLFLKYFYTYLHFMSFFVFVLSLSRILIWMHINFYFTMHSTFTACTSVVPFHTFFSKLNIKVRCSNFKLLSLAYIAVFAHTV